MDLGPLYVVPSVRHGDAMPLKYFQRTIHAVSSVHSLGWWLTALLREWNAELVP